MIDPHDFKSIVILTGAGVSAESGIRTFRDANGLWEEHRIEDVASPEGFRHDPRMVHRFYNARRKQLVEDAKPNAAHFALAEFEQIFAGDYTLVTQNIDNLHEQAGSDNLLHMHGELLKARCSSSGRVFDCRDDIQVESVCQCCGKAGALRPHIVWFGEMPFHMDAIEWALAGCDLFVAIGTSGNVYPAAGFVQAARVVDATTVEFNLEPSANSQSFDHSLLGPATQTTREFFLSDT